MMRCSLQPFELYAYAKINPKTKRLKQCLFREASNKVQIQKKKKKKKPAAVCPFELDPRLSITIVIYNHSTKTL